MIFEKNITISYAHSDNESGKLCLKEWVKNLHKSLEINLSHLSGLGPQTRWDKGLQGNDLFTPETEIQILKTAIAIEKHTESIGHEFQQTVLQLRK